MVKWICLNGETYTRYNTDIKRYILYITVYKSNITVITVYIPVRKEYVIILGNKKEHSPIKVSTLCLNY